jgi:FMN-dependent oxidoreductase (nitrilotriacetate monooxygenase family)
MLNAFVMATPVHHTSGLWRKKYDFPSDPNKLETWVSLGKRLDQAGFASIFFADHLGAPERFKGSFGEYARMASVFPTNDPLIICSALAATTERLGLVVTSSTIQNQPFTLARQISTLDHMSSGRAGWNLVTSALRNSYRNLSMPDLVSHDERYRRAREFVDVTYKLWEGSWDEGAVINDAENAIYADPAKVHEINHAGELFSVEGPFMLEPSPQRTPFLFLAGASDSALDLAAAHAEGWTMISNGREHTKDMVDRLRIKAAEYGRNPDHIAVFQGLKFVIGSTEAEAKERYADIQSYADPIAGLVGIGGIVGIDLSAYGPDDEIDLTKAQGVTGLFLARIPKTMDPSRITLRQLAELRPKNPSSIMVGTPEQIADEIGLWAETGIDGIDVEDYRFHEGYAEFIEHVLPILKARNLFREGDGKTLRSRVFGEGDHLPSTHPAAAYRGAFA